MIPILPLFLIYIHFSQFSFHNSQFTFHNYNNTVHCSISNKKILYPQKRYRISYIYNVTIVAIILVQPLYVAEVLTVWQLLILRIHTYACLE